MPCPLYPRKRTCAVQLAMSALGQKRTLALQQCPKVHSTFRQWAISRRLLAISPKPECVRSKGALNPHIDFATKRPEIDRLGQKRPCTILEAETRSPSRTKCAVRSHNDDSSALRPSVPPIAMGMS